MEEKIVFDGRRSGKTLEMEKELRKLPYKITYTKKTKKMMEEEKEKQMIDEVLQEMKSERLMKELLERHISRKRCNNKWVER